MFKLWKFISVCILLLLSVTSYAKQVSVKSLRYWTAPDHTRVVFDLSSAVSHKILLLQNPARVVIDLKDTRLSKVLAQPPKQHPLFNGLRSAPRNKKNLRVVIDLKEGVSPKSFILKPTKKNGHRLVVDLFIDNNNKTTYAQVSKKNEPKITKNTRTRVRTATKTLNKKARDIVIAIDAGHGGEDSGALGKNGTREKKVVLQIAKKLAILVNKEPGMKAVMVREGDYYIGLRKRMEIARSKNADLFVSIHADAFKNSKVKGASVFTLSNHGASSEAARWLAKHENSADLVGGVKLADKEDVVANVLMDLSQKATKDASRNVASKVLKQFKNIGHLHSRKVQKAGFMVLKSPDIPSILVETAFISNPKEERKLKSRAHQSKMAQAIFQGVVGYFSQYAPPDTYYALNSNAKYIAAISKKSVPIKSNKRHVISSGDTLSEIADHYGVSLRLIKSFNSLNNSRIRIGQVLEIPMG
jgi:N-acetylmuramoyl-L-alanine amidase